MFRIEENFARVATPAHLTLSSEPGRQHIYVVYLYLPPEKRHSTSILRNTNIILLIVLPSDNCRCVQQNRHSMCTHNCSKSFTHTWLVHTYSLKLNTQNALEHTQNASRALVSSHLQSPPSFPYVSTSINTMNNVYAHTLIQYPRQHENTQRRLDLNLRKVKRMHNNRCSSVLYCSQARSLPLFRMDTTEKSTW